ncbi:MAG: signal peptidase I [bacterium]|nr:signal peptidase I [bacterium]
MEPAYIPEERTGWSKLKDGLIEFIEFIAIVIAILAIIRFFVAEPHKVSGSSMYPTFHDGDYLITNKLALRLGQFQRGEVVILQNPRNLDQVFIKRIIGLPLEHIKIQNGHVFINGRQLKEPYLHPGTTTQGGMFLREEEEVVIPENQYLVMGDNRGGSSDSREWGPVNKSLLVGQAWLRYWPPQKFTFIGIDFSTD